MAKYMVRVEQLVEVTLDEGKFTPAFMEEFQRHFFPLDTVPLHAEHLAQMYARGVADDAPSEFIEGYGPPSEMGIKFRTIGVTQEVDETLTRREAPREASDE